MLLDLEWWNWLTLKQNRWNSANKAIKWWVFWKRSMNENVSDLPCPGESQNSWYIWYLYRYEIKHKYHKNSTFPIAINNFVCESIRDISQCFRKKMDELFEHIIVRIDKNWNWFITNSGLLILGNDKNVAEVCEDLRSYFTSMKIACFHTKKITILIYFDMIIADEVRKTA